jgi:glycine/D-amino acid oxidase-like deaminating enzyme
MVELRPVSFAAAAHARLTAGLRPFRPTGFRIEAEPIGRTLLVHNYGHGGCGVTLSWGTASRAVELALQAAPRHVAVLGAGAVGLATARLFQERGVGVTVYARELPPHTTSDVAGALWSPVTLVDEGRADPGFAAELAAAARFAHARFETMAGDSYGIRWVPFYLTSDSPAPPTSWEWAATPELFRAVTLGAGEHPFPSAYAHRYRLMLIEPAVYLAALVADVRAAGARIVETELSPASMAALKEDVIVNCTGIGAAALFGDRDLVPIKGQLTILEPQPGIDYAVKSTTEDLYMFPRRDGVVLGGSHQRGDWTLTPDPREAARILAGHQQLFRGFSTTND